MRRALVAPGTSLAAIVLMGSLGAVLGGCLGVVPTPLGPTSLGTTSSGILARGVPFPERGPGFVRARPGEDTRFGTPGLVESLQRALATVDEAFPGTSPTRVGDLSAPQGGRHSRHGSHRTGRDVDVIFYLTDASGRSVSPRGWLAFSRFGHAFEEGTGHVYFFDDARNWQLVRSLLLDRDAAVQWIFVSRGLKTRLLEYALAHETNAEVLVRAAYVLHQPQHAAPHDDHFHVRVYCTAEDRASGCRDVGPRWPWLRPDVEQIAGHGGPGLDDATLLAALLDGDDPAATEP